MPHVVTSPCVDHKYQECVAVCPVEAFREADTYLVIDPDECIDCGACIPECPVDAIFADTDVPEGEKRRGSTETPRNPSTLKSLKATPPSWQTEPATRRRTNRHKGGRPG